ncbi:MAG: L-threonylcarbamoyladenylate synthase [Pontixanthobacter sp.]
MRDKNATEALHGGEAGLSRAADILRRGGIVAVPTETVYGLAGRADCDAAVAAIYWAKGRPDHNPLIVHVSNIAQAQSIAQFSDIALATAARAWPGPLTLVLPLRRETGLAAAVTGGRGTVALRMAAHPVMRDLIDRVGAPLAAPSANRSNAVSPTTPTHVRHTLDGRIDAIVDGGHCAKGLESSIVAIRHDGSWDELRAGPVDLHGLYRDIVGGEWDGGTRQTTIEAPGQMARHYSPGKPMRLNAKSFAQDEFGIGFDTIGGAINLSITGDLSEAAHVLYDGLHRAASSPLPKIAVAPIPMIGIGVAINDRLRRAAV